MSITYRIMIAICGLSLLGISCFSCSNQRPKPPEPVATTLSSDQVPKDDGGLPTEQGHGQETNQAQSGPKLLLEKSFTISTQKSDKIEWYGEYILLERELTFIRDSEELTKLLYQIERPVKREIFTQAAAGETLTRQFPLEAEPDPDDIGVIVDQSQLAPSEFHYYKALNQIVLNTVPSAGVRIIVDYRLAGQLPTDFFLGYNIDPSSIHTEIMGEPVVDIEFDPASGILTFDTPPRDKAPIKVTMRTIGDPILSYPMHIPIKGIPSLEIVNKDDPSHHYPDAFYDEEYGVITFIKNDFKKGETLLVRYRDFTDELAINLPMIPIEDSIEIDSGRNRCPDSDFSIVKNLITTDCELLENEPVIITYQYYSEAPKVFKLDEIANPDSYIWTVLLDDQESTQFRREGNQVIFTTELSHNSRIKIMVFEAPP